MDKGTTNNPKGRPPGIADKRTLKVAEKAAELGCDPIEFLCFVVMAKVEKLNNEVPDLDQRIVAAKELASYIAPKLKAIEHYGDTGASVIADLLMKANAPKS